MAVHVAGHAGNRHGQHQPVAVAFMTGALGVHTGVHMGSLKGVAGVHDRAQMEFG